MQNLKISARIIAFTLSITTLFAALPFKVALAVDDGFEVSCTNLTVSTNTQTFSGMGTQLVKKRPQISSSTKYEIFSYTYWRSKDWSYEQDTEYLIDRDIENKFYNSDEHQTVQNHYQGSNENFATESNETDANGNKLVGEYKTDGSSYYVDIVHDLEKSESIDTIVVGQISTQILRAGHYFIYVSNSESTLFNTESLAYEYKYENAEARAQVFKFTDCTARYVAMRVYSPYSSTAEEDLRAETAACRIYGNAYLRLAEFNVFGKKTDDFKSVSYLEQLRDEEGAVLTGTRNLIANREPSSVIIKSGGVENSAVVYGQSAGIFTDGDESVSAQIRLADGSGAFLNGSTLIDNEEAMYAQLNYKLDSPADISKFELFLNDSDLLSAGHLKLSVAEKEEELFTDTAYTSSDIYSTFGSGIGFEINKRTGEYIGVRIICPVRKECTDTTALFASLSELAVYGTYTEKAGGINYLYRIGESTRDYTGNAEIRYTSNPDANGYYGVGATITVTPPASVRDSNDKLQSFVCWQNSKGETIGTELTLEITSDDTTPTTVRAIYGQTDKTVEFTFLNYWGEEIDTVTVPFGGFISREQYEAINAQLGDVPGKQLKYSEFRFGSRKATMPVWNKDIYNYVADANTTFTPVYEASQNTYSVTYEGEEVCLFDQKVTYQNENAKYWTVNGNPWCVGTEFTAYVTGDMVIAAVTDTEPQSAFVSVADPIVAGSSLGVVAKFQLPDGAVIVECGVIFSSGSYDGELKLENVSGNLIQKVVSETQSGGNYMITLKNNPRKVTRKARAYVTYTAGGATQTIYSNTVEKTIP